MGPFMVSPTRSTSTCCALFARATAANRSQARPTNSMPRSPIIVLLGAVFAAVGCNSRPHAPALLNEPIYQDDQAGFRLEIPDSWIIYAKSNLTRGEPLPEER